MRLFISYSHVDHDVASEICRICDAHGISHFRDEKDVRWGDSIRESVSRGLADCTHILVILSPATTKSWWVPFELGRAVEKGLIILPYLTHPALELPSLLSDTLWVCGLEQLQVALRTLRDPRGGPLDDEKIRPALVEAAYARTR